MTLEASVLKDNAVRKTPDGYEVDIHLAWYRSLPLSCVENIELTIDGQTTTRDDIRIIRDDRMLTLEDVAALHEEEWFVQDPLTVKVKSPGAVGKGAQAEVRVSVATRIPYIIIGPNVALVKRTDVVKKVVVQ